MSLSLVIILFRKPGVGKVTPSGSQPDMHIKWNRAQNHYVYMLISQYWYRLGYTFLYQMLFNFESE